MDSSIEFTTAYPLWIVILGALLLWMGFLWKEWQGWADQHFWLHSLVSLLAVFALAAIALRPALSHKTEDAVVLQTDGYQESQLDSLMAAKPGLEPLVYVPGKNIREQVKDVSTVFVIGDGLASSDFGQIADKNVVLLPNKLPQGVQEVFYSNQLVAGDTLSLSGYYQNTGRNSTLVLTDGTGTALDSIVVHQAKKTGFQLKTVTKTAGNFVYRLLEKNGTGEVLRQEPIPFRVHEPEKMRVVILNEFPSFETKYLKNFLAEEGHEVMVRSQITNKKYKFEYLNTSQMPLYRLTEEVLANVDILLVDTETFLGFSRSTKGILDHAVKNGLGLFLQPSERLLTASSNHLSQMLSKVNGPKSATMGLLGSKVEKYPFTIGRPTQATEMQIGTYGVVFQQGQGRMATTILRNTFQLKLKGESDTYRQIWTSLLESVAKQEQATIHFNDHTNFAFLGRPFTIGLQSQKSPKMQHGDGYLIAVSQHPENREQWSATTIPKKIGWNTVSVEQDSLATYSYYVMEPNHWQTVQRFQRNRVNRRFFANGNKVEAMNVVYREIPLYWFFMLFLGCSAYLWLYPKLGR
ncbi:Hypothetical protein I595_1094 [Croceitalea dokdonensis DOKDO 023]|uniref:Uncharacterized protein n=1 Tax=Croceitalea dokdonensis DOKDO 023 TaxID=1300341 RepID=A0A0N8H485_9FLAO|nr:hypothetical protein [Croceitalea dokdonensis]KPM32668.1 Hypothetical protein I595_1094 [Croceitalea dokdonensis DOKDO 023]